MTKKDKKKNSKLLNHFTFKRKIYYLIIFFLVLFKKILKKERFIPLSIPFLSNQIFYDTYNKNFFKFKIRDFVDFSMVDQIFYSEAYNLEKFQHYNLINGYYKNLLKQNLKPLILDCGGHIGLATKYFSTVYSDSKIIFVEPEKNNFDLAKKNNSEYLNIEFLNNAIGSNSCRGSIYDPKLGNNAFRINKNNKGDINIIPINNILSELKKNEIPFIIKIDIEGFENELFKKNTKWIDVFPVLIIELHDWMLPKKSNSNNFLSLISKCNRDFLYSGENIFSISNEINLKSKTKYNI